ncbi:RING-H2 finger protein ATL57-like [Corylus avellana]|uniref:RING-H2 finger protein ATL57-like n=1 Tax=Corylus avellana TaxID=13451 RepID=UPI001E20C07A|nr:RING-H2 finger protein ATL57-like [Corylus avellana]
MKPHSRKLLTQSLTTTTTPSPPPGESVTSDPSPVPSQREVVAALSIVLVALFIMGFLYICSRCFCANTDAESPRRRRLAGMLRSSPPRKGVDPVTIRALPVFSYCGDAKNKIDCAICLSEFEEKEAVKVIPFCKHVFHPDCIDTWLSSNVTCPVCRATRFSEDAEEGSAGRSTVKNHETCIEVRVVGVGSFSFGMRRNRSCSNLGDRAVLHRTSSF